MSEYSSHYDYSPHSPYHQQRQQHESDANAIPSNLCYDPNVFTNPSFNRDSFVQHVVDASSASANGSLSRLSDDLETHAQKLKSQLIDLINREYTGFISLSGNLVGTQERIQSTTDELVSIGSRYVCNI